MSSSDIPPPMPAQSLVPQTDPVVRLAAKVYLAQALAPVITLVLVAGLVIWFLRS